MQTLKEMAAAYRESAEKCRRRVRELEEEAKDGALSETERLRIRYKITLMSGIVRETLATANYLEHYYGEAEHD